MTTEMFKGKIIKVGNSLGIIIPKNVVEYSGIKEGQFVKYYFKKEDSK